MIDYIPQGFSARKRYLYARGSGISPFGELKSQVRKTATIQVEKRSFEYRKSSIKPPGGLIFSSTFEGGLNREGGLI